MRELTDTELDAVCGATGLPNVNTNVNVNVPVNVQVPTVVQTNLAAQFGLALNVLSPNGRASNALAALQGNVSHI